MSGVHYELPNALDRLREVFPDIDRDLAGKHIVDYGCGSGYQAVALAMSGAERVTGIEINETLAFQAHTRAVECGVADRVCIERTMPKRCKAHIIISQNSFEHFLEAKEIIQEMRSALLPGGRLYITFAPPWYAPWGAHMAFFCRLPWVHLLFPERTVLEARKLYRFDGAATYREAGLAKMSVRKFEHLTNDGGLRELYRRYDCIHGLNVLQYAPGLREFAINRVSCVFTATANIAAYASGLSHAHPSADTV